MTFYPPSPEQLMEVLSPEYGLAIAKTASHITTDLEEARNLCQSEWFAELRNLMIQLVEEILQNSSKAFFHVQDKWLKVAKEREQIDIALEFLLFWYKDLMYTKCHLTDKYINIDSVEKLNKQALLLSQERITRGIEAILSAKKRLYANVNPQLLLEQLVLRLKEG
ncbi:DNA polymerase III subunit delta' C-terminal domain-containing protein [Caldalkalibacillus mannanilyticus]|uniref:DNA polymerase III subunit delta' C-terminal domain-containing protein n=1 Tax=Caldalkalibacillus mannanilyticus TaxID=1418 RepID=UPI0034E20B9D